jgi:hypothetical protein
VSYIEGMAEGRLIPGIQQSVVLNVRCLVTAAITKRGCHLRGEIASTRKFHAGRASGSSPS